MTTTLFDTYAFAATGSSTPRTMPDRLADVINVRDWGAKGDNSHDDTTNIQAAINYAIGPRADGSKGGRVVFPAGKYITDSSVIHVGSEDPDIRVDLVGVGMFVSTITTGINQGSATYDNVGRIEGLGVNGGTITLTGTNQSIHDCRISSVDASAATSALITDCGGDGFANATAENNPHGATVGSYGIALGDFCSAQNTRIVGGREYTYMLSGQCPSLINCATETCTTAVRVGWTPGGEVKAYGFVIQGLQTERCDTGIDLYSCQGGFIGSVVMQGQIGSTADPNPTIHTITWSSGTATATTSAAHNLPSGVSILQIVSGDQGTWSPSYSVTTPGWIIATRVNSTQFTYYLPDDPGTYTTDSHRWTYPEYYALRCRDVSNVAIMGNAFNMNSAYASIDLDYGGAATGHTGNILWGCDPPDGIIMPSSANIAGWNFSGVSTNVNPLEGLGGWTGFGTVASPLGKMVFADLPGQSGVHQAGPYEGQEYDIKDGQKNGGGTAAFDDQVSGGGSGKYRVRYNGTSWRRVG